MVKSPLKNIDKSERMCYYKKKSILKNNGGLTVEEKMILCPDCGKLLLKATNGSRATLICWCRRCRTEKRIPIEP